MKSALTNQAQDWLSFLLAGLGLSLAVHEFFGGLFLALAVASVLAGHRKDPRSLGLQMASAALFAVLAAGCWDWLGFSLPVQIGMAAAGVIGRPAGAFLAQLQDRIETRGAALADRAIDRVLPEAPAGRSEWPGPAPHGPGTGGVPDTGGGGAGGPGGDGMGGGNVY